MDQDQDRLRQKFRVAIGALIGVNVGVLTAGVNFSDEGINGKKADVQAAAVYEQRIDSLAQLEQTAKMMSADAVALVRYQELGFLDKSKAPQLDKLKQTSEQARADFRVSSQKLIYDIFTDPVISEENARNIIERLAKLTETPLHKSVTNADDVREFDARFLRECAIKGEVSADAIPLQLDQISDCTTRQAFPRLFVGAAEGAFGGGLLTFAFLMGLRRYQNREKPEIDERRVRIVTKQKPE